MSTNSNTHKSKGAGGGGGHGRSSSSVPFKKQPLEQRKAEAERIQVRTSTG